MAQSRSDRIARLLGNWQAEAATPAEALRLSLAALIEGARLPAGQKMPGQRELADALGIARGTVSSTYGSLISSGHLTARQGSGTYVRALKTIGQGGDGRLTSFDEHSPRIVADLSSGALPGTAFLSRIMPEMGRQLHEHYLDEAGYYPAGLPALRAEIAALVTEQGLATSSENILITAGSQQAVWLIATALTEPGSLVVVEDPTYRGALEAFAGTGARTRGVPFGPSGIDIGLLASAAKAADLVYLQPALHNPTGIHTSSVRRAQVARIFDDSRALVVDDQSSADLAWTRSQRLHGLERHMDPARLLVVGTFSKLFWGGIRVGWIRGPKAIISRLTDLRRGIDLSNSVLDQMAALLLLPSMEAQRDARREHLSAQFRTMSTTLSTLLPNWSWWLPAGGSGLWVDTGEDAISLSQRALARGVRLTPGPSFSPHAGHRRFLRLPVWHHEGQFAEAMAVIAELTEEV